ncbi:hypothetical protein EBU71_08885 [bacterium]|nr:hypothetical protein [Candidatus Elulimicrobium humile]
MRKKILIQIDTFPNTQDKLEITRLCIEKIKLLGYPILLTSHMYIPKSLTNMVDYWFSDSLNIILPDTGDVSFFETYLGDLSFKFKIENIDKHSSAVITSWMNGIDYAKRHGWDYLLKLEYDAVLTDKGLATLLYEIENIGEKQGFFLVSGNYTSQKFIYGKVDLLFSKVYRKVESAKEYLDWIDEYNIPSGLRRMAPVFTTYLVSKYSDFFKEIESSGDDGYFEVKVPESFRNAFPGFLQPLTGSDGRFYLCSWGMCGDWKCPYEIVTQGGNLISQGSVSMFSGNWSYTPVDITSDDTYYLKSEVNDLEFTLSDLREKKFGEVIFSS